MRWHPLCVDQTAVSPGQPYIVRALPHLPLIAAAVLLGACGSTAVTDISAPSGIRCEASITAEPATVPADATSTSLTISAARDCTWSARSEVSWLQLASTSGQGASTIAVTVAANTLAASRSGTIVVNEQRLMLNQEGRGCTITLTGPTAPMAVSGGRGTLQVATLAGCAWTVTSSSPWLVPLTTSGSGAATVAYDVSANTGAAREASLTVSGRTFLVSQDAAPTAPPCSFSINPTSRDLPASGGTMSVDVTSQAGCAWTVTGGASWITVTVPSGVGSGKVDYTVAANPTITARQATLTIAGRVHTINQAGLVCTITVTPPSQTFSAAAATGQLTISTLPLCPWSASSNAGFVLVGSGSGSGPGTLSYQVLQNTGVIPRTATITVSGQTHTITQSGTSPCTYGLAPPSRTIAATGATATVTLTTAAGCAWTAVSSDAWLTVAQSSASGNGPAEIAYTAAANTAAAGRTATITAGGQTHTVTQSGATQACTYDIAPPSRTVAATGATATVTLTTTAGCAWTAVSSDVWLTVALSSASGSGPADITYTAAANTAASGRTATIAVGGKVHTVTQDAAAVTCAYTLTPGSRQMVSAGGSATVAVSTGPTCAWTAVSSATWLTIAQGSGSGAGPATIAYTAAANTTSSSRTATITVAGQVHTVTQDPPPVTCTYSLSPASREFQPAGGSGTVMVTTGPTCAWTAVSSDGWVTVTNPSGTGTATINYVVGSTGMGVDRTATITVNGQVHSIRQRRTD